ncbi:MAG: hypothetical protein NZ898_10890 [Myxococcota bacterium]|nr:hypothetical protein [Myxococcota bacterium]
MDATAVSSRDRRSTSRDRLARRRRAFVPTLVALQAMVLGAACEAQLPGEPVGRFDVTAILNTNTCGRQAVPARAESRFVAELREDGPTAWWHVEGERPVHGHRDADGRYAFELVRQVALWEPQPARDVAGCTLQSVESLEVAVRTANPGSTDGEGPDAGSLRDAPVLDGAQRLELVPMPEGDCRPALVAEGGNFTVLPCEVRWSLRGAARATN